MRRLSCLVALALLPLLAPAAQANLLANGSFEIYTSTFAGDGGGQLLAGNTSITGWTVVGPEIAILRVPNSYQLTSSNGVHFLDVVGYQNVVGRGVTQTVAGLVIGKHYVFGIDLGISNVPSCVPGSTCSGPVSVLVQIGTGVSETLTHDSDTAGNIWGRYTFDFVATTTSAAVTVTGSAKPAGGAYIGVDNLSLDQVLEGPVFPYGD